MNTYYTFCLVDSDGRANRLLLFVLSCVSTAYSMDPVRRKPVLERKRVCKEKWNNYCLNYSKLDVRNYSMLVPF